MSGMNPTPDNYFEPDLSSIVPQQEHIVNMFPEMQYWTHPDDVKHKDKPDKILPPAVCENGQHTGNPHCPVIETPDVSAVPLPAAMWLFASALIALVCVRRRK
jgi:hypothetical protein